MSDAPQIRQQSASFKQQTPNSSQAQSNGFQTQKKNEPTIAELQNTIAQQKLTIQEQEMFLASKTQVTEVSPLKGFYQPPVATLLPQPVPGPMLQHPVALPGPPLAGPPLPVLNPIPQFEADIVNLKNAEQVNGHIELFMSANINTQFENNGLEDEKQYNALKYGTIENEKNEEIKLNAHINAQELQRANEELQKTQGKCDQIPILNNKIQVQEDNLENLKNNQCDKQAEIEKAKQVLQQLQNDQVNLQNANDANQGILNNLSQQLNDNTQKKDQAEKENFDLTANNCTLNDVNVKNAAAKEGQIKKSKEQEQEIKDNLEKQKKIHDKEENTQRDIIDHQAKQFKELQNQFNDQLISTIQQNNDLKDQNKQQENQINNLDGDLGQLNGAIKNTQDGIEDSEKDKLQQFLALENNFKAKINDITEEQNKKNQEFADVSAKLIEDLVATDQQLEQKRDTIVQAQKEKQENEMAIQQFNNILEQEEADNKLINDLSKNQNLCQEVEQKKELSDLQLQQYYDNVQQRKQIHRQNGDLENLARVNHIENQKVHQANIDNQNLTAAQNDVAMQAEFWRNSSMEKEKIADHEIYAQQELNSRQILTMNAKREQDLLLSKQVNGDLQAQLHMNQEKNLGLQVANQQLLNNMTELDLANKQKSIDNSYLASTLQAPPVNHAIMQSQQAEINLRSQTGMINSYQASKINNLEHAVNSAQAQLSLEKNGKSIYLAPKISDWRKKYQDLLSQKKK